MEIIIQIRNIHCKVQRHVSFYQNYYNEKELQG